MCWLVLVLAVKQRRAENSHSTPLDAHLPRFPELPLP